MQNPFQYGKVVSESFFTDREIEFSQLMDDARNSHNVVLHSPRRYGKTSLLMKVAKHLRSEGFKVAYLDFFRISSKEDFMELYSREIMAQYPNRMENTLKRVSSLLKGLRPVLSLDPMGNTSLSLSYEGHTNLPESLESVISLPENIDDKSNWVIIFDEFQEISKLNGDRFDDLLRSVIQHHRRCCYFFSGSRYHLLQDMFNSPGKAFYRFGKVMQLAKIPPELMKEFLLERFAFTEICLADEIADRIIASVENIPNYVQYLAAELWNISYQSKVAPDSAMLDTALSNVIDGLYDYFLKLWDDLSQIQKKVLLSLLSQNANPYSQEFQKKYRLGAISSTQRALEKLISSEIIYKEQNVFCFSDPLFRLFLILRIAA